MRKLNFISNVPVQRSFKKSLKLCEALRKEVSVFLFNFAFYIMIESEVITKQRHRLKLRGKFLKLTLILAVSFYSQLMYSAILQLTSFLNNIEHC